MRPLRVDGWESADTARPGFNVYHRSGETFWVDIATRFREGKLPELTRARSARTSRVFRACPPPLERACYFKEYLRRDVGDVIKDVFRASRARRALLNERMCAALGFMLPRTLCLLEEYRKGALVYCALVTEAIDDAPNVRDWLTDADLGLVRDPELRRSFLRAFAGELGAWHRAGLYHGDLRLSNVLCRKTTEGWSFFWLDNERNRKHAALPLRPRVNNLMRVNFEPCGVSATDRMRFWRTYVEAADLPPDDAQQVVRQVVDKTYRRRKKRGWV